MRFIYVMSPGNRDIMLQNGFHLMKSCEDKNIWVFQNNNSANFSTESDMKNAVRKMGVSVFVLSDVLTF